MSLCEKFKKPKIRSASSVVCFRVIYLKMQADLTNISFYIQKNTKCVSDYCFIKGSLEIYYSRIIISKIQCFYMMIDYIYLIAICQIYKSNLRA